MNGCLAYLIVMEPCILDIYDEVKDSNSKA